MNRAERRAVSLGTRAARTEEDVVLCHEHEDAIELCDRDCAADSHYSEARASERIEDAIESLRGRAMALAIIARVNARAQRGIVARRITAGGIRAEHFAYAARLLRANKSGAGPDADRTYARRIVAENRERIAALVAKAKQWLHDLVLQSKAGAV